MDQVETRTIGMGSNDCSEMSASRRASKREERRMRTTLSLDYSVLLALALLRPPLNNINSWNLASRIYCRCSIRRRPLHHDHSHRLSQPHPFRTTLKRPSLILRISWQCSLLQLRPLQSRITLRLCLKFSMIRFLPRLDHPARLPTIGSISKGRCWR
jgi:hypothetical protein